MKLNKVKYFGICAATLLTIAPVATSAVTIASQPITTDVVKADTNIDEDYQNSLSKGFEDKNLTKDELNKITTTSIRGVIDNGSFIYSNVGSSAALFANSTTADAKLISSLKDDFLKLFVKDDAVTGFMANSNYKTKMSITGARITSPVNTADIVHQFSTLRTGDKFVVTLTTVNRAGDTVGTKVINVTINEEAAKGALAPMSGITANKDQLQSETENSKDNANAIKDARGGLPFKDSDLSGIASTNPYYYAVKGVDTYTASTNTSKYVIPTGSTGVVYTQLIPVPYTDKIAKAYDAKSFVFLDKDHKETSTVPTAGDGVVAYVKRQVTVGDISSKDYPVFKYNYSGSSIPTYKNGETLKVNEETAKELTYKHGNQNSLDSVKTYVEGSDFAGIFKAYKSVDANDNGQDSIMISYKLPDVNSKESTSYIIATATNPDNGVSSSVKIPVTVTGIPVPLNAPTVTKFPDSPILVASKTTKSIDPLKDVKATYVGSDGKTHDLPKEDIKVTVKDSAGKDVALNNGMIPTTTNGTYTVTYVFKNSDDTTKTVTKTLTVKVSDTTLDAPTVKGFVEGTYSLSNVNRKSIKPFDAILKTDKIDASYVNLEGKAVAIDAKDVKVAVKDSADKEVALNSDGTIPITKAGKYKVTYTFANGDDASKTIAKTITLDVNDVKTSTPTVSYASGAVQNPSINKQETASFDPMSGVSFNYSYTNSDSTTSSSEKISSNYIKVSVTKDGKDVALNSDGKLAVEAGTYKINYTVVNPKDNASVLNYTRTLTVTDAKPDKTEITKENGVVYIDYVWGYGVNLWKNHNVADGAEKLADGSLRKLMTGSAWKYDQVAKDANGNLWYRLGTNQWVQGEYASKTPIVQPNSWEITNVEGVGTIYYVPGYGINLWTSPDQTTFTRKLAHGTAWKYFKIAKKDGKVMYNLGGNQWVDGQYFK